MPAMRQEPRRTVQSVINDLIGRVNTDTRRLRVMEQEAEILKSRMAALEQAMAELRKLLNTSSKGLVARSSRAEDKVARMETLITELAKAIKGFAPLSEIRKLEQLIEIYSPLKSQFVTREELDGILEERESAKR